ncbi:MAG: IclR family transcriptional regulator [Pseudomonadota bacterium]
MLTLNDSEGGKHRDKGSAVDRALAVLQGVALAQRPMSATELNEALGLPKATLHRICAQLERDGYLQRDLLGKRLRPGPRLRGLALGVMATAADQVERHAILRAVSEAIGETCNLTMPDGDRMVYVDRVETHWPLRLQFQIGTHVPLHCTSSGKLFLSSLPAQRRKRLVGCLNLEKRTNNTLSDPESLLSALAKIRDEEVGTDDQEFVDGMVAVAVPIKAPDGQLIGTLATHAPIQRMTLRQARGHLPALRHAADRLSALIADTTEG